MRRLHSLPEFFGAMEAPTEREQDLHRQLQQNREQMERWWGARSAQYSLSRNPNTRIAAEDQRKRRHMRRALRDMQRGLDRLVQNVDTLREKAIARCKIRAVSVPEFHDT